jgi:hypothetical protein
VNKLEAKNKAYLYATGKAPAPTTGSKAIKLEGLCSSFYDSWQTEPGMEWQILSKDVSAGLVTADNDTFTLAQPVHFLSQKLKARVRIVNGSNVTYYRIVDANDLNVYPSAAVCALVNNTQIKFAKPFAAGTTQIGGTILVPAISKLPAFVDDTSLILIPQPEWLPWRMAAQYALTDRQLNHLYDDLLAQANEFMKSMKLADTPEGEMTSSTGIDYFGTMGNVGSGVMGTGGTRTDTIF